MLGAEAPAQVCSQQCLDLALMSSNRLREKSLKKILAKDVEG